MKKLMIAAAVAAIGAGAFADAQVYDFKLNVKTTQCKKAKLSKAFEDLGWFGSAKQGDEVAFRGSATRKIAGVIWGCDCDTISRPSWRVMNKDGQGVGGFAFWDQTKSPYKPFAIPYVTFDWAVLNRVGKMTNVEGTWIIGDSAKDEAFYFMGAGFGTCTLNTSNDCASYVKSIKGNFAGFMEYNGDIGDGCIFCGETISNCLVVPFCVCYGGAARDTSALTVAYGTWQIKYNSSTSKKLRTKEFITKVRNFTGSKAADIGVALDAAYLATKAAVTANTTNTIGSAGTFTAIKRTPTAELYDVASKDLAEKGAYYTHVGTVKAREEYKTKQTDYVKDPGAVETAKLPSVAKALIVSLGHVEASADAGDSGDDWGDDSGDDWGDDWGDDDDDFEF